MSAADGSIEAGLAAALVELHVDLAASCSDPWWLIGSAAMRLIGVREVVPQDLDLLTSRRDAEVLIERWCDTLDVDYVPQEQGVRFRSRFARFRRAPLPVEVMGALEVRRGDGWQPAHIGATRTVALGGIRIPLPTVAEQIRLLELFGRGKDLDKARRLRLLQEEVTHVR